MFRTPLWVCVPRISVIENMTRQLDLASFSLQADCGYCSYYRPQDESTTCSEGCSSHFHIPLLSVTSCYFLPPPPFFSPFYRFISFILTSSRLLCAVLPPSPLRPYSPLLSFLSLSVTHSTSLIQQLECTRTHSHTHTHTCPHTPVSNLYEMIPNAFGSPWEFPL